MADVLQTESMWIQSTLLSAAASLSCSALPGRCSTPRSDISEEFARRAADSGLLRPKALQQQEDGTLWDGPRPSRQYSPHEVIDLILSALRSNDVPSPHAGTALLRRFSTEEFRFAGEPDSPRLTPQGLTAFFEADAPSAQYGLLLERDTYAPAYPSDIVSLDDDRAWQEVCLESTSGNGGDNDGVLLAKLGWSLVRRDGCWMTDEVSWHDFRADFRPGIGEEEWDRSFG